MDGSTSETSPVFSSFIEDPEDRLLLQPYRHLLQYLDYTTIFKIADSFNVWFKVPEDKLRLIINHYKGGSAIILLIDDIQDGSPIRNGIPTAHKIYGVASTANAALFANACKSQDGLDLFKGFANIQISRLWARVGMDICRGQGMELYWRDRFICPDEKEYRTMVTKKTGSPMIAFSRLLQSYSADYPSGNQQEQQFDEVASLLGLYVQVMNDYGSLCKDTGYKVFAEDLTEGKFSFPIIHAIRETKYGPEIAEILRQRPTDLEVKKHCVSLIKTAGSLDYTKSVLEDLYRKIEKAAAKLGGNRMLMDFLDEVRDKEEANA